MRADQDHNARAVRDLPEEVLPLAWADVGERERYGGVV